MLAERVEIVIGVDTHKHTHTAAVVTAATGGPKAQGRRCPSASPHDAPPPAPPPTPNAS